MTGAGLYISHLDSSLALPLFSLPWLFSILAAGLLEFINKQIQLNYFPFSRQRVDKVHSQHVGVIGAGSDAKHYNYGVQEVS